MRILMAHDMSPRSDVALRRAVALVRARGGSVDIVHVVEPDLPPGTRAVMIDEAERWLEQRAGEIGRSSIGHIEVRAGVTFEVILDRCEETRPDLVVLGAQRREVLEMRMPGSAAERLMARSRWPVLVANREPWAEDYLGILVAIDQSSASGRAAVASAGLFPQTKLDAVYVVELSESVFADHGPQDTGEASGEIRRFLQGLGCVERFNLPQIRFGRPIDEIREVVAEFDISLVVFGCRPRTSLAARVFGSTIAEALRRLSTDILLVPSAR